jgi:hypothetical protein
MESFNAALVAAACLSAVAALLHVAIIFGGPDWYRFFGAGERLAKAAEDGQWYPAIVTFGIAAVLGLWAAYALAGAGVLQPLPFLKIGLCIITAVYLIRGLAIIPFMIGSRDKLTPFILWSSLICIVYGGTHLLGLVQVWPDL